MVGNTGPIPPSSGSTPTSPSAESNLNQVQTGLAKYYQVKGNTAIKKWAQKNFPQMSESQLNKFVQQFLMTICQQISNQIAHDLKRARKAAQKLRRSEQE